MTATGPLAVPLAPASSSCSDANRITQLTQQVDQLLLALEAHVRAWNQYKRGASKFELETARRAAMTLTMRAWGKRVDGNATIGA